MKKKFMCLMMAMVMVLSLAACGGSKSEAPAESSGSSSEEASAPSGAAFKLGGTAPLTGGAAIYGNAAKNGAQIAVDEINAQGGMQIELLAQDDEHDADEHVPEVDVNPLAGEHEREGRGEHRRKQCGAHGDGDGERHVTLCKERHDV